MERSVKDNNDNATRGHAPAGKCTKRKKQCSGSAIWEDEEPSKEQLLQELKVALKELKLIQQGKLKASPAEEFLDEL